jgi:multidrug efflux pump subunit AcrA (membrane-fusion protein)
MEWLRVLLRKKFWIIFLWLATSFVIAYNLLAPPVVASQVAPSDSALPQVFYDIVRKKSSLKELIYPVRVDPAVSVAVTAEFDGVVKGIEISAGEAVKKGQVLLFLRNEEPGFHFAPVAVRSPISGVVAQVHTASFAKASRGEKLVTVMDLRKRKMIAEVPAADLSFIKEDSDGIFSAEDFTDGNFPEFFVNSVSPAIDPKTNTAPVELMFFAKDNLPMVGTVGFAKLQIPTPETIQVPEASLTFFDEMVMVRLVDAAGRVRKQKVEIQPAPGGMVTVSSGLVGGEHLIVRAERPLKDGEKVEATLLPGAGP